LSRQPKKKSARRLDPARTKGQARSQNKAAAPSRASSPTLKTLDRMISKAGIASRTDAKAIIARGRVKVNGQIIRDPEHWVNPGRDRILLDGQPLRAEKKLYVLLYKPKGYITTARDPDGRPTVFELVKDVGQYLFPVGRLDQDTSGLLLLTNDTAFAERLTNPDYHVPKSYLVKASTHLTDEQLGQLRDGLELKDGPTRPARVERLREGGGRTFFQITITEGRNRQVRRMVEALGAKVLKLVRTSIGPIGIGSLPISRWRHLTPDEVRALLRARQAPSPAVQAKERAPLPHRDGGDHEHEDLAVPEIVFEDTRDQDAANNGRAALEDPNLA
jgi:pseudouridine synthase